MSRLGQGKGSRGREAEEGKGVEAGLDGGSKKGEQRTRWVKEQAWTVGAERRANKQRKEELRSRRGRWGQREEMASRGNILKSISIFLGK